MKEDVQRKHEKGKLEKVEEQLWEDLPTIEAKLLCIYLLMTNALRFFYKVSLRNGSAIFVLTNWLSYRKTVNGMKHENTYKSFQFTKLNVYL